MAALNEPATAGRRNWLKGDSSRPRRGWCCLFLPWFLLFLSQLPAVAQEARWEQLLNQVAQLSQQNRYREALPLAEEALREVEKTFGAEGEQAAFVLNMLGTIHQRLGEYAAAEPLHRRALEIDERILGPEHPTVAYIVNNLAGALQSQAKFTQAEPLYRRSLAIREKVLGPDDPAVAVALNNLASLIKAKGRYAEAEPLYRRALSIAEKKPSADQLDVALALNNLADLFVTQAKYTEAEPLYRRSLAIREKALPADHPDTAAALNNLAALLDAEGRYSEAEALYRRSLAMWEKTAGPEHPQAATALNNLAGLYEGEGKFADAEQLYQRSMAIREKALGPHHPDTALAWNNLAELYAAEGRFSEAERLYMRGSTVLEKALGPDHPSVATVLDNLAGIYDSEGRSAEAEKLYQRALSIREKAFGSDHPLVAISLNNLANLDRSLGRLTEAEPLYQRSLAIREKALGPSHPDVALALNNLALLYADQKKDAEAEPLFRRAIAIAEQSLGPDHPNVATLLIGLGALYRTQEKFPEAEALYRRSLAIREKSLGPEHPDVANALNNLGVLYYAEGKPAEAVPLYRRSLAIVEQSLGSEHPQVTTVLNNFASLYYGTQRPALAGPLFERSLENLRRQFAYHFTYMSEKDRLQFLDQAGSLFPVYFSFCLTYRQQDRTLAGKLYDVVLWQKGFVAASIAAMRGKIAASGDKEALALLEKLKERRNAAARLLRSPPKDPADWRRNLAQLEQEANEIEKELVRRSSALAEERRLGQATWRDVQGSLEKDEAAVEFVRFRFHDGRKWTEVFYYIALVLTPTTTAAPEFIVLGNAESLEGAPLAEYRRAVASPDENVSKPAIENPAGKSAAATPATSYQAFWQPLERALRGARRIFISPDGVLNQLAFGLVPDDSGQLLVDRYDLRLVSNTREILQAAARPSAPPGSAVLVGNPRYDLDEASQRAAVARILKPQSISPPSAPTVAGLEHSAAAPSGVLAPLPGTQAEVEAIRALLSGRRWHIEVAAGENALKAAVMRVFHPRVLHIATHGFFLPDPGSRAARSSNDPMLRSGLFFAGADRALAGAAPPADLDDGILTAYEATGLDLYGTELVVLSACETGLGQTKAGEGVFGLRRALQEAGAEAVLMSLWSVPDKETLELMQLFYTHWLEGEDKHAALRTAQLEVRAGVRQRYGRDMPYYWGGFVLAGK